MKKREKGVCRIHHKRNSYERNLNTQTTFTRCTRPMTTIWITLSIAWLICLICLSITMKNSMLFASNDIDILNVSDAWEDDVFLC